MSFLLLAGACLTNLPAPLARLSPTSPRLHLRYVLVALLIAIGLTQGLGIVLAGFMIAGTGYVAWRSTVRRKAQVVTAKATASIVGNLLGDLEAGASMSSAVQDMEVPEDLPSDMARTLNAARSRTGISAARVLIDAPSTCPDLQHLGATWSVAESRGIALARLLEQMQRRIDAKIRHAAATSASLQGPQATAIVLSLLPLAGIGMGTAMGANPAGFLLGGGLGSLLLVVGVALVCVGFLWVQMLIDKAAGTS